MFPKVDLVKEIVEETKEYTAKEIADSEEALTILKQQLIVAEDDDFSFLKGMGFNVPIDSIKQQIKQHEYNISFHEQFNKQGNIVHIDVFKHACIKYNLRFLEIRHYKGHVDVTVASELKSFIKSHKTFVSRNLYIMAPEESFILKNSRPIDPVLVYDLDNNYYQIIKKWGNDFTMMRCVKGLFLRKNIALKIITGAFMLTIDSALFLYATLKFDGTIMMHISIFIGLVSMPFILYVYTHLLPSDDYDYTEHKNYLTEGVWNTDYTRRYKRWD